MDSSITADISALLADIIRQKPTTSTDAAALLEKVEMALTTWLISELPIAEQKALMVAKWAVKEAEQVAESCCAVPSKKKSIKAPVFLGLH